MKLLHLFSNHKLTGPAEPAVRLAGALAARGHEVIFAHAPLPAPAPGYIDSAAARYGVETVDAFRLPKHFRPLTILADARALARFIDRHRFDLVHCHLVNDHLTGVLAARRSKTRPKIVRTNHDAVRMERGLRERFLFAGRTDALIERSQAARDADLRRFPLPADRVTVIDTSIELDRFDPARELPDLRGRWGLTADQFVVGIAARIQGRRRFDVLLRAAALAHVRLPAFRLVLIGRGTRKREVAVEPARRLGLDGVVVFADYLRGDDYAGGLAALDAKVFLVPGTDGSCRAAREAMALGVPLVVSRRGMLPELVADGETGLVVDDTPERLAEAFITLATDAVLRRRLGDAARAAALDRFDPAREAERTEQVYRAVCSKLP